MAWKTYYDDEARERALAGAEEVYLAVAPTMGPKGKHVTIRQKFGAPIRTRDGVTVAKNLNIDESDESRLGRRDGAYLMTQAPDATAKKVGDGTSTATVLGFTAAKRGDRLIRADHNPVEVIRGIRDAADACLAALPALTRPVAGDVEKVAQVASISVSDPVLGKVIADVITTIGEDGVITVQPSTSYETTTETVEGYKVDRGFVSPYMVTDQNRMEARLDAPAIFITDKKLTSYDEDIAHVVELVKAATGRTLVVVADELEGDVLGRLNHATITGAFRTLVIKAPSFGDRRSLLLEDLAVATGATVASDSNGYSPETFTIDMLGGCRQVIADKAETAFLDGSGGTKAIADRVADLRSQLELATTDYDRDGLKTRIATLIGKIAVIKVGGATEDEIEETTYRVDDAVAATKAAVAGGIVAGGGVTLLNLASAIDVSEQTVGSSYDAGRLAFKQALEQPFREIMKNAGLNVEEKLYRIRTSDLAGFGFDVASPDDPVLLMDFGVIDPADVTKAAIINAVASASSLLSIGVLNVPTEDAA